MEIDGQWHVWRKRKKTNSERKWTVTNARDGQKRHWEKKDSDYSAINGEEIVIEETEGLLTDEKVKTYEALKWITVPFQIVYLIDASRIYNSERR